MSGSVLVTRDGTIATVALSNPGRLNALDKGVRAFVEKHAPRFQGR